MTLFKKYIMPVGLLCLLSAIIPVTHFISDYFYSAEQGIREWADQAVEEEKDALSNLALYLESDGKEKLFDLYQQNLELLKQRRQIVHLVFDSSKPIDTVISKELTKRITSGQQYAAVFLIRSLKDYEPVKNTRESWQKVVSDIDELQKLGFKIHKLKRQEETSPTIESVLSEKLYTIRKKADQHQAGFQHSIQDLTNWLEGFIWWITYIILAVIFVLCMITITIRNRIAEARSKELSSLFENTPLAIAYLDAQDRVKQVNQAFTDLFGFRQEELKDQKIDHFIVSDDYRDEAEKLDVESLTRQTFKEQTQRIDKEGNIIHVMISAFPIDAQSETASSYYTIYQDISNLVEANEDLRQIAKEKQTLLEEIHHRVKNNLAIISSLMFLKAETTENASLRDSLKEQQDRIQSMALIHEQLYQEAEDQAQIDMQHYLPTLIDNIKASHTETEATIDTHVDADHIKIPLDRSVTVGLLVTELVNNAFKHAFKWRQHGIIYVSLQKQEEQLRLTVQDDGQGLPEDFQLEYGTMGMQLLQKLTKQLDGTIKFDSGAEAGTIFTVSFEQKPI